MVVTIIIPTFNRAKYIKSAIRSLTRQAGDMELDVLVVDDGSTDETSQILDELQKQFKELRVITKTNGGVTAARNAGLANLLPETEFVTFLDSDDTSPPGAIASQVELLVSNPEIDLAYGALLMVSDIDEETLEPSPNSKTMKLTCIQLSCAMFRRRVIEKVGLFDEDFVQAEDSDYFFRVFEAGTPFIQTDTICLYYRRHADNLTKRLSESRQEFLRALAKSMRRRRANPGLSIHKPRFDVQQVGQADFY